jgi:hypothetical protein
VTLLRDIIGQALPRFRPGHASAPANTFVFGIITPDEPSFSLSVGREGAHLADGVRDAEYLIQGEADALICLFTPDASGRAEAVSRLTMRPDYPFNDFLLSILLNALDLGIDGLGHKARRYDGPFPFPPRWPAPENIFRTRLYQPTPLPAYDPAALPALIADGHPGWAAMYEWAWKRAFANLRQPEPGSGFIANFIDPAFNANTFLWDTCFMALFMRYAPHTGIAIGSLDNFYAKQHDDGFICREISTYSGRDMFAPQDPRSTGPNILAWTESLLALSDSEPERWREVYPALVAYHRWWSLWRMHPDGGMWTSGWGSGMDNQTRVPASEYHHRGYTWVDASMQQALSCYHLLRIGDRIGRDEFRDELEAEYGRLCALINERLWDEASGFYYDRAPDGTLSTTKSIGAYWGLLGEVIPPERAARMIAHLSNPDTFGRPHPVPTIAHDSPDYNPHGGYWQGGVWSPTNYMVLHGLHAHGHTVLAHTLAVRHLDMLAQVFAETGTLYENYAPEVPARGAPSGKDFVGWTGLSAIAVPIEFAIGLRRDDATTLTWDIRLTERHGVLRFPLAEGGYVDAVCEARHSPAKPPGVRITTTTQITLVLHWEARDIPYRLAPGTHELVLKHPVPKPNDITEG